MLRYAYRSLPWLLFTMSLHLCLPSTLSSQVVFSSHCATDPTYKHFESLQRTLYEQNPALDTFRKDLNAQRDFLAAANDFVNDDPNAFGVNPDFAKSDAMISESALPPDPPTCYQNRFIYDMLRRYVYAIEAAYRELNGRPLRSSPRFGTWPINQVNAYTLPAIGNVESILAFNDQLFSFDQTLSTLILRTVPINTDSALDIERIRHADLSTAGFYETLKQHPGVPQSQFMVAVLEFMELAPWGSTRKEGLYDSVGSAICIGMELFAVGHEYGHVINGDKSPIGTLNLTNARQPTNHSGRPTNASHQPHNKVPVLLRSWTQELEADEIGTLLTVQALRDLAEKDPTFHDKFAYATRGILLYFVCSEIIEEANYVKEHGAFPPTRTKKDDDEIRQIANGRGLNSDKRLPALGDHPPAWLRSERALKIIDDLMSSIHLSQNQAELAAFGDALIQHADLLWRATKGPLPQILNDVQGGKFSLR